MFTLASIKKKPSPCDTRPGTYLAEITAIVNNDKYFDGSAFIIKYRLFGLDGECAGLFEETFLNNSKNRRTQELVLLMQQLQIDEADDLVGVTIQVEIKYRVTDSGARFPSIIARTPLPPPTLEPSIPSEETH